jgi:hypothetical protein
MTEPRLVLLVPSNEDPAAAKDFQAFGAALPNSAWYKAWAPDFGAGAPRATVTIPGAPLDSSTITTLGEGESYIAEALAAADPTLNPDGNTLYLFFAPMGVYPLGGTSIQGHHWAYGAGGDGWGLIQRGSADENSMSSLEAVASHEYAEAVTDSLEGFRNIVPAGENPWNYEAWNAWEGVGDEGGFIENGDYCTGTRVQEGSFTYQPIFTNTAAALGGDPCVPTRGTYFNVSADADWYSAPPGSSIEIPIVGWTTAKTADFMVAAEVASISDPTLPFSLQLATPRTVAQQGRTWSVLNNGEAGTVSLGIPADVPSGSWLTISLWTWHADAQGLTPPGEDASHLFVVGAYVE